MEPRTLPDVSKEIRQYFDDQAKRRGGSPVQNFRASSIGDPCHRYLWHTIMNWENAKPIDGGLIGVFEIGDALEPKAIEFLKKIGFKARQPDNKYWREKRMSGRLDLLSQRDDCGKDWFPVEIKWLGSYGDKYITWQDMIKSDRRWVMRYPGQLVSYQLLYNAPLGLFLIFDKQNSDPNHIWFDLENDRELLDYAESILKKVENVTEHIDKKEPPERVPPELGLCIDCEFIVICQPPIWFGEGAMQFKDGRLAELLERRADLQPFNSDFEKVNKELKKLLDGVESGVAGDWIIQGTQTEKKAYSVEASTYWRHSYKKIGEV